MPHYYALLRDTFTRLISFGDPLVRSRAPGAHTYTPICMCTVKSAGFDLVLQIGSYVLRHPQLLTRIMPLMAGILPTVIAPKIATSPWNHHPVIDAALAPGAFDPLNPQVPLPPWRPSPASLARKRYKARHLGQEALVAAGGSAPRQKLGNPALINAHPGGFGGGGFRSVNSWSPGSFMGYLQRLR